MAILRTAREEKFNSYSRKECEKPNEWQVEDHVQRLDQPSWIERYDYESNMILDKIGAKEEFEKRGYKGKFLIKNLHNYFDTEGMDRDYDLIVANDFLEHIANPSNILSNSYDITTEEAKIFVSVPNWRMGHTFIYRGIFDYDNFVYFMHTHGWSITEVKPSPLKTPYLDKLSSEESMPDELIQSWNWYFIGEKRKF